MHDFVFFSPQTAPIEARPVLRGMQKKLGFVPNLYAGLAASPAVLKGTVELSVAFSHTSLSPAEQITVSLAASVENGCEFCVAAHTASARRVLQLDPAVITALRSGEDPADPKLRELARFTRALVNQRGWMAKSELRAFLDAGYTQAQSLEVILGVALKTLTNYANHILWTPLNPELAAERWETP